MLKDDLYSMINQKAHKNLDHINETRNALTPWQMHHRNMSLSTTITRLTLVVTMLQRTAKETRGPRGPWNAHLRQKIFISSLFSLLYVQQATLGCLNLEAIVLKFKSNVCKRIF